MGRHSTPTSQIRSPSSEPNTAASTIVGTPGPPPTDSAPATISVGTLQAWPRLHEDNADRFAQVYKDVGELAEHETRVLFLDTEYGFAMMYHAEISGDSWPNVDDLAAEAIDGRAKISAEARFVRDYEDWGPTYFIVTDMRSLRAERDLQEMLAKRATLVRSTSDYQVYKFHPVDAAR